MPGSSSRQHHLQPQSWALLLVVLLTLPLTYGCTRRSAARDEAPELRVALAVSPPPASVGPGTVEVSLLDASGASVQGAELRLHGDMTHAGMVPLEIALQEQSPGTYSAEIELSMAGDWIFAVRGSLPDGRLLVREFPLFVAPAQP